MGVAAFGVEDEQLGVEEVVLGEGGTVFYDVGVDLKAETEVSSVDASLEEFAVDVGSCGGGVAERGDVVVECGVWGEFRCGAGGDCGGLRFGMGKL